MVEKTTAPRSTASKKTTAPKSTASKGTIASKKAAAATASENSATSEKSASPAKTAVPAKLGTSAKAGVPAKISASEEIVGFADTAACVAWFEENHATGTGFLCKIGKGAAKTVGYADVLDVALCFGWIDGQKWAFDDDYWLQRFTPRTSRSKWSKINRDKVDVLIAAGLMRPVGQRAIDAAKADGRWDAAYSGAATATVPDDLAAALEADPQAKAFFETLRGNNRYAILYRIQDAKKPETRAARITKFVAMCHDGETIH